MEISATLFDRQYAQHYNKFNEGKPYQKEVEFIYEWAGKPKSIIDIGCGTANYWSFFPKKTRLLGVDKSKDMIDGRENIVCADITKYRHKGKHFDCAVALFDVLNYIPEHSWWANLPIRKGGYFIFDIWDKKKVEEDGFKVTKKDAGQVSRYITPLRKDANSVDLRVEVLNMTQHCEEIHTMYIWGYEDILRFCGHEFEIVGVKSTQTWQQFYKLRRK